MIGFSLTLINIKMETRINRLANINFNVVPSSLLAKYPPTKAIISVGGSMIRASFQSTFLFFWKIIIEARDVPSMII